MTATVQIRRYTGAASTGTVISSASTRLGSSDEATNGSAVRVPTSGSNYSYWANTGLWVTVAADNAINNVKWYTDGTNSFGTGLNLWVGAASAYAQATGTAGSTGNVLSVANYAGLHNAPSANAFQYTSDAASMLVVAGSLGGTTGSGRGFVVLQM